MAVTVSARMGAGGVHSSSVKAMAALVRSRMRWVGAGSCFCRERSWKAGSRTVTWMPPAYSPSRRSRVATESARTAMPERT